MTVTAPRPRDRCRYPCPIPNVWKIVNFAQRDEIAIRTGIQEVESVGFSHKTPERTELAASGGAKEKGKPVAREGERGVGGIRRLHAGGGKQVQRIDHETSSNGSAHAYPDGSILLSFRSCLVPADEGRASVGLAVLVGLVNGASD